MRERERGVFVCVCVFYFESIMPEKETKGFVDSLKVFVFVSLEIHNAVNEV